MSLEYIRKQIESVKQELIDTEEAIALKTQELSLVSGSISLCRDTIQLLSKNRKVLEEAIDDLCKTVLGSEFSFKFLEVLKDGELKGLKPVLVENDLVYEDIADECGSGMVAIIDFAFRLMAIVTHGGTARIIIADEPIPEVDDVRMERFVSWLDEFCERLDFQIIMTTHSEVKMGKTYKLVRVDNISQVYDGN